MGTPAQKLSLILTLANSETYIVSSENNKCDPTLASSSGIIDREISCNAVQHFGSFDKSESSTFEIISKPLSDAFVSQYQWATDALDIGDQSLEYASFAVSDKSELPVGFLGLGIPVSNHQNGNILSQLVSAGVIGSRSFGLSVSRDSTKTGHVSFGGVDSTKFDGSLHKIPLIKNKNRPEIQLDSAFVTGKLSSSSVISKSVPAFINIGTKYTYLSQDASKSSFLF